MNKHSNIISINHSNGTEGPSSVPEGYVLLVTTPDIFSMDLVGKNLRMNSIEALWSAPDPVDHPSEQPSLFVKAEQKEQAMAVLTSLDLIDFTTLNGQ
jgi:hypothetical protein